MEKNIPWEGILIVAQPVKQILTFYETQSFISVLTWASPISCITFRTMLIFMLGTAVSFPHNPNLEAHPLSAVHGCVFNIFATAYRKNTISSIRNLTTIHARGEASM
jgi:hypothetical protein